MDKKEFWVDFQGSLKVTATDADAAFDKVIGILSDIGVRFIQIDGAEETGNDLC